MTPDQRDIVDTKHAQKYLSSCPASLCEMLLKFEGAIPLDSSQFQDADPSGSEGVSKFLNMKLADEYTLRRIAQAKPWEFPMADIKAKLAAKIPVGVYLNPAAAPAHG